MSRRVKRCRRGDAVELTPHEDLASFSGCRLTCKMSSFTGGQPKHDVGFYRWSTNTRYHTFTDGQPIHDVILYRWSTSTHLQLLQAVDTYIELLLTSSKSCEVVKSHKGVVKWLHHYSLLANTYSFFLCPDRKQKLSNH